MWNINCSYGGSFHFHFKGNFSAKKKPKTVLHSGSTRGCSSFSRTLLLTGEAAQEGEKKNMLTLVQISNLNNQIKTHFSVFVPRCLTSI